MFLIILKYVYWSKRSWYVVGLPSPTFDSNVNISSSSGIFFRSSPALLSPKPEKKNQFHFLFLTGKRHQVINNWLSVRWKQKKSLHEPFNEQIFHGLLICLMESSSIFKLWLCCLNCPYHWKDSSLWREFLKSQLCKVWNLIDVWVIDCLPFICDYIIKDHILEWQRKILRHDRCWKVALNTCKAQINSMQR